MRGLLGGIEGICPQRELGQMILPEVRKVMIALVLDIVVYY